MEYFVKKLCFKIAKGHLRSFGASKLKTDEHTQLMSVQPNL